MKQIFKDVHLTFHFDGEEVSGILNGSNKFWNFSSESPAFKKIVTSGRLRNGMMFTKDELQTKKLHEALWDAAEKPAMI